MAQEIQITVCDDELAEIQAYECLFERYMQDRGIKLCVETYSNPQLLSVQEFATQNILILDIQMGNVNGIELARQIRKFSESIIIIFSTNYLEYALEGYEVRAFRYLKKPLEYEQFCTVLDEAVSVYKQSRKACLSLRCGYTVERVRIDDILYAETEGSHLRVVLKSGEVLMANLGISALEKELSSHSFYRCHKAFLVNLNEVKTRIGTDVLMRDGRQIPVSKHRMKDFLEALMNCWGERLL